MDTAQIGSRCHTKRQVKPVKSYSQYLALLYLQSLPLWLTFPTVHQTPIEIHTACGDVTCSFKEQLMRAVLRESILTANSFVILLDMVKNVATMIYLSGYFSGKVKYLLQSVVPHCLPAQCSPSKIARIIHKKCKTIIGAIRCGD